VQRPEATRVFTTFGFHKISDDELDLLDEDLLDLIAMSQQ
jgi:hypothetical protein